MELIIGYSLGLASFYIVPTVLFFRFSKSQSPIKLGALFGLMHLVLIPGVFLAYVPYLDRIHPLQGVFGWGASHDLVLGMVVMFFDLPSSFFSVLLANALPDKSSRAAVGVSLYLILGALQYFLIGIMVGVWGRRKRRPN